MQYKVNKSTKLTVTLMCLFLLLTVIFYMLSVSVGKYKWAFQLVSLIFAVVDIQTATRHIMSEYLYFLDGSDLKIYKILGKKSTCVADISLLTAKSVLFCESEKKKHKCDMSLDYCKNIKSPERKYFIFDFNGKRTRVCLEIDGEFSALLDGVLNTNLKCEE